MKKQANIKECCTQSYFPAFVCINERIPSKLQSPRKKVYTREAHRLKGDTFARRARISVYPTSVRTRARSVRTDVLTVMIKQKSTRIEH